MAGLSDNLLKILRLNLEAGTNKSDLSSLYISHNIFIPNMITDKRKADYSL